MSTDDTATLMQDPRVQEILEIVAKETSVAKEKLVPEATIEELGIASLDMVQTIFAIESKYDVEIPVVAEQQGQEFTTVGSLLSHVMDTLNKPKPQKA
ncbi:MAG TPA: phosphopantetheine-binding protein [Acetobacteraceae bacterium]|nr:phosphopantetheine-binding protein [Acetobacteraceae bacterium]